MTLGTGKEKQLLAVLIAVLVLLLVFRLTTSEKAKTAPLTYRPGAVVSSPVRHGVSQTSAGQPDPIALLFAQRDYPYPGVIRDLFRMSNPAPKPKKKPEPVVVPVYVPPPIPQKTPEEIAADAARAELARFRFIGYLTEKDNSVFLQKDGETFVVKRGDTVQKTFKVKEVGRDHVILTDSVTHVETRVDLSGSGGTNEPTPGGLPRPAPGFPGPTGAPQPPPSGPAPQPAMPQPGMPGRMGQPPAFMPPGR